MKLIILRLNVASKPPPIFKGVTEIIINSQPCKGINLTTRHTWAKRASRVAIVHDMIKETIRTHLTLVHIFHANASVDNSWVAHALSWCRLIRYGRITSVLATHYASKFAGLHISCMCQYIIECLFIWAQPTRALIDTGGGYHLVVLNLWSRPLSTFASNILHFPLIAPSGLQLCQHNDHLAKSI
jgi:hypothetical protein